MDRSAFSKRYFTDHPINRKDIDLAFLGWIAGVSRICISKTRTSRLWTVIRGSRSTLVESPSRCYMLLKSLRGHLKNFHEYKVYNSSSSWSIADKIDCNRWEVTKVRANLIVKGKVDGFSRQSKHSASHFENALLSHFHSKNNLALKLKKKDLFVE